MLRCGLRAAWGWLSKDSDPGGFWVQTPERGRASSMGTVSPFIQASWAVVLEGEPCDGVDAFVSY